MVLVKYRIVPVSVRIKKRQREIGISSLVFISQNVIDLCVIESWLDSERLV